MIAVHDRGTDTVRVGAGVFRTALLYLLVISIVILPIRFGFFSVVICVLVFLMSISVVRSKARSGTFPYTPVYFAIAALTLIYACWGLLSIAYQNNLQYVFEDSAGFLVYLIFPILFSYIVINRLASAFAQAIVVAATIVALINVGVFAVYYSVFGDVQLPSLMAVNAALSSFGFTWDIGASGGILRADTKAGHYILLGIGLLLFRFVRTRRTSCLMLIGFLLIGALMDGHRALLAAIAIFSMVSAPIVLRALELYPLRFLGPFYVVAGLGVLTFSLFIDVHGLWERLSAVDSSSMDIRFFQIHSLMAEIGKHPIFGNGFGSHAEVIRSPERPFMYEMDFVAVCMKLGMIGAALYFATYLTTIVAVLVRDRSLYGYVIFAVGLSYFFYMGTNGGFAMSPISALFHILLFVCVAFGLDERTAISIGHSRHVHAG